MQFIRYSWRSESALADSSCCRATKCAHFSTHASCRAISYDSLERRSGRLHESELRGVNYLKSPHMSANASFCVPTAGLAGAAAADAPPVMSPQMFSLPPLAAHGFPPADGAGAGAGEGADPRSRPPKEDVRPPNCCCCCCGACGDEGLAEE